MSDKIERLKKSIDAATKAINLVLHSARKLKHVSSIASFNADQLEPYDALVGRFERAVEVVLGRLSRSIDLYETAGTTETLRDRLGLMHKLGLVSNTEIWIEMREVRNKIAHEYLPEQVCRIYNEILGRFQSELDLTDKALQAYKLAKQSGMS